MTQKDKPDFDKTLDHLADMLRVNRLNAEVKTGFFSSLKRLEWKELTTACNQLAAEYKPRRFDDFPVIACFHEFAPSRGLAPILWDCICCKEPFPQACFSEMKCGCTRYVCWDCQKCDNHCRCSPPMKPYPPLSDLMPKSFFTKSGFKSLRKEAQD